MIRKSRYGFIVRSQYLEILVMDSWFAPLHPLFTYLIEALVFIVIGILLANILVESGIFSRISGVSKPLCRISGLSSQCTVSILAIFLNPTAGKAMFADLYKKGEVKKEEVVPTLIMSTFPVVVGESLFRVQLPTAIVLLGPVVGTLHVCLNLFSSFIQTAGAVFYTRVVMKKKFIPGEYVSPSSGEPQHVHLSWEVVTKGIKKGIPDLKRIIPVTIAAVVIFSFLLSIGLLELIGAIFNPVLNAVGLPGESSAALMAQLLRSYAGYAVVAGLLTTGILTLKQALMTLILGSMLVITLIYIRYSLPLNLSLYGKYGVYVTIVTYLTSMAAKLITLFLVIVLI